MNVNVYRIERELDKLKKHPRIFWRTIHAKEKLLEELKSNTSKNNK